MCRAYLAGNLVAGGRATDGMANPIQSRSNARAGKVSLRFRVLIGGVREVTRHLDITAAPHLLRGCEGVSYLW